MPFPKILKGYKTNNHSNGEIEVTFFREFHRDTRLRHLVTSISQTDGSAGRGAAEIARIILDTESDNRGTVASLCREIDEAALEGERFPSLPKICTESSKILALKRFSPGPGSVDQLTNVLQSQLVEFYDTHHNYAKVCSLNAIIARNTVPNFISIRVEYLKYLILDGRRIVPTTDVYHAPNSIIQTRYNGGKFVGQVTNILKHSQRFIEGPIILLQVRWFKALEQNVLNTSIWDIQ